MSQSTKPKLKIRRCKRCHCTDDRACAPGCSWVGASDVCDACLADPELQMYEFILDRIDSKKPHARRQLALFEQIITLGPKSP